MNYMYISYILFHRYDILRRKSSFSAFHTFRLFRHKYILSRSPFLFSPGMHAVNARFSRPMASPRRRRRRRRRK